MSEKFYGNVGFVETKEVPTGSGIWKDISIDRPYYGEVERNSFRTAGGDNRVNDNVVIVNTISIVADAYATEHFSTIRYISWLGTKWRVQSVEVNRPCIRLTLGEVWNGHGSDES